MFASVDTTESSLSVHAVQPRWCNLGGAIHLVRSMRRKAMQRNAIATQSKHKAMQSKAQQGKARQSNAE
eukprot:9484577-Pyramimonas_sp.AAC.1